jgi:5-methylcytosine-specific restriction endonuclease McrA
VKTIGKKGKQWLAFRRRLMRHHLPNHQGYYVCYICRKWVRENEVELDHVKSRSRHPELVFDEDNIKPICHDCNFKKGSKEWPEL